MKAKDLERIEYLEREIAQGFGLTDDERAELRKLQGRRHEGVPWTDVRTETAYGREQNLSFAIRVF